MSETVQSSGVKLGITSFLGSVLNGLAALTASEEGKQWIEASLGGAATIALGPLAAVASPFVSTVIQNQMNSFAAALGHSVNHDLEKAVKAALIATAKQIGKETKKLGEGNNEDAAKQYYREYILPNPAWLAKFRQYIEEDFLGVVIQNLNDDVVADRFIASMEDSPLHPAGLIAFYIEEWKNAEDARRLPFMGDEQGNEIFPDELLEAFLIGEFERIYPLMLLQELKKDEKAKTVFYALALDNVQRTVTMTSAQLVEMRTILEGLRTANSAILGLVSSQNEAIRALLVGVVEDVRRELRNLRQIDLELHSPVSRTDAAKYDASFRLNYKFQYAPFMGRREEMAALEAFMQSGTQAHWWYAYGPGGMGKSRLAQELCFRYREHGWLTGFLSGITLPELRAYVPNSHTLIVLDYAGADKQKAIEAMHTLYRRHEGSPYNLRILLLEREVRDFTETFKKADPLGEIDFLFHPEALALLPFTPEQRWALILEAVAQSPNSDLARIEREKESTLTFLEENDPEGRPLYTLMTAEALAAGESVRGWNVNILLEKHTRRMEEKFIDPLGLSDIDRDGLEVILVLTTLTRGMNLFQINICLEVLCPNANPANILASYPSLGKVMTINNKTWFRGIYPDIPGEFYIVSKLDKYFHPESYKSNRVQQMVTFSWVLQQDETWWMWWLCFQDFVKGFPDIFKIYPDIQDFQVYQGVQYSKIFLNKINWYLEFGTIDDANFEWRHLFEFYNNPFFNNNLEIALELSKASYNISAYCIENDINSKMAVEKIMIIEDLFRRDIFNNSYEIANQLVSGIGNLCVYYGKIGYPGIISNLATITLSVFVQFPNESNIAFQMKKVIVNYFFAIKNSSESGIASYQTFIEFMKNLFGDSFGLLKNPDEIHQIGGMLVRGELISPLKN